MAAGLVAALWGAGVVAEEPSPACDAFTADAKYVEREITTLAGTGLIKLRVPKGYNEIWLDEANSLADKAVMFFIDMDTWAPSTATWTSEAGGSLLSFSMFATQDHWVLDDFEWMFGPESQRKRKGLGGREVAVDLPETRKGPFGLTLLPFTNLAAIGEVYVGLDGGGQVESLLGCDSPQKIDTTGISYCNHRFSISGMDVRTFYLRSSLHRWREIQSDVTAFLTCATRPAL